MTPDQIQKIRTVLQKTKKTLEFSIENKSDGQVLCLEDVKEALALLPCPTCNGTRLIRKTLGQINGMPLLDYVGTKIPCPDCLCKTCGGTGEILKPMPKEPHPCNYINFKRAERTISCPDCQLPEEMRVMEYGIAQAHGEHAFGFWYGPNPSLQEMLNVDGRDENSVIWRFNADGTDDLIYRWVGEWRIELEDERG